MLLKIRVLREDAIVVHGMCPTQPRMVWDWVSWFVSVSALLLFGMVLGLRAQEENRMSIHQLQSENPPVFEANARQTDNSFALKTSSIGMRNALISVVFGYHPYWINNAAIDNYRFDLLSHVAYFSYEVEPSTGLPSTTHNWLTTPLVEKAKANGTKVLLAVTNFGAANNRTLLGSTSACDTLIANLLRLVQQRGADGVNIDFESVSGDQRDNLVRFFKDLKEKFSAAMPGSIISVAAPAVDWNNAWDVKSLGLYIDIFFVMCYDYYWSSAANAGPVAPLDKGNYNVKKSLEWYVANGVPAKQIVMGVPYYGYDWPVQTDLINAPTSGTGTAIPYASAMSAAQTYTRLWDDYFRNPWYKYNVGTWRQTWYDDEESLALKYDLVRSTGLGGVGMWALGYDNGQTALWDLLEQKFTHMTSMTDGTANIQASGFDLFPNPSMRSTSEVRVAVHSRMLIEGSEKLNITIFNVLGQEIWNGVVETHKGAIFLPPLTVTSGMYEVVIRFAQKQYRQKLIILQE